MRRQSEFLLLLAPAMIILFLLMIYPTIFSWYISLHSYYLLRPQEGQPFVGVENYIYLFTNPAFWNSLRFTFIYVATSIAASFLLGLGLALILNEEFRGRNLIRSILILPLVLTPVVVGFNWRFMYSETVGVIPYLLRSVGIETKAILGDPLGAELAVISVDIWQWTPFVMLILLSNLQMIAKENYEAAELDGAGSTQKFRFITLPLIKPAVTIALTFRTLDALKSFDAVWVMTGGGPGSATDLATILGYRITFQWFQIGRGTAFAVVMAVISTIIAIAYMRLMAKETKT